MAQVRNLDAHETPPAFIKKVFKFYQKISQAALKTDDGILDFSDGLRATFHDRISQVDGIPSSKLSAACGYLRGQKELAMEILGSEVKVYAANNIPGLLLIPSLIPPDSQIDLLSKLLHRDLADQQHKTNVHLHHQLPYHAAQRSDSSSALSGSSCSRTSFFNMSPKSLDLFLPYAEDTHKPFTVSQFLNRKLRWVTLGGQYDWTQKRYPPESPPFPADLASFIHGIFPEMTAEAAIVNIYTPGDTLSIHRDVSEDSDRGLVSISLGCDGIFVIGLDSEKGTHAKLLSIRLRSGDAVFMTGQSRFAWHGVPQIIPRTCPEWLCAWPANLDPGEKDERKTAYEAWRGWVSNKRINLNVRQMRD